MWGFHLGRRDPNLALIGHGRKLDARSLSKTPPSVLPLHFSRGLHGRFHAARDVCLLPAPLPERSQQT